jgi:DUF971 family protein
MKRLGRTMAAKQLVAIGDAIIRLESIEETTNMTAAIAPMLSEYELSADLAVLIMRSSENREFELSAERLRLSCKCAHCTRARIDGRFPPAFPGIAIVGVTDLGYGLNIAFSDGHWRGIYPKSYLVDLVDC